MILFFAHGFLSETQSSGTLNHLFGIDLYFRPSPLNIRTKNAPFTLTKVAEISPPSWARSGSFTHSRLILSLGYFYFVLLISLFQAGWCVAVNGSPDFMIATIIPSRRLAIATMAFLAFKRFFNLS